VAARGRDAPIGGQAVLEGVMMRGIRTWSVAVRAPTAGQLARGQAPILPDTAKPWSEFHTRVERSGHLSRSPGHLTWPDMS